MRRRLFLIALERGFLDDVLDRFVVAPFVRAARAVTRLDRWLCAIVLRGPQAAAIETSELRDE